MSSPSPDPAAEEPVPPESFPRLGDASAAGDLASGPLCSCGHVRRAHEHYRRGSDCALCDCLRFRKARRRRWGFGRR